MWNNNYKILLVDDESDILEFLGYNLRRRGFQIFEATNGKDAIELVKTNLPHLILLDLMMPLMDGIDTCDEIRKNQNIFCSGYKPIIIFLSAKSEEYLQFATESFDADDYLTKPIKTQLLINCIEEKLNKNLIKSSNENPDVICIADLMINKLSNVVTKNNQKYLLTRKQFEILILLASSPNKIFKKEEIFAKVWGEEMNCNPMIIDEYIRKINDKTGIENIKSIYGYGYKYEINA